MNTFTFCDRYGTFTVKNVSAVLNVGTGENVYEVYFANGDKEIYHAEFLSMELE